MEISELKSGLENYHGGFFSIRNYTNKNGEISNYLINVKVHRDRLKKDDENFLENLKPSNQLEDQARIELLNSLRKPDETRSQAQIDSYLEITHGLKMHKETGKLYIYGQRVKKQILVEGNYPAVNSRPLTIAKNKIKKHMKTPQMRMFCVGNVWDVKAIEKGTKAIVITL